MLVPRVESDYQMIKRYIISLYLRFEIAMMNWIGRDSEEDAK